MGVYFHVYVGPVLVCKYGIKETVTKKTVKFNGCSNPACSRNKPKHLQSIGNANFCPQCGFPIAPMEVEREIRRQEKSVDNLFDLMSEGGFREDTFDDCWGGLNREKLVSDHDLLAPADDFLQRKARFKADQFALHLRGTPDVAGEIAKCEEIYAKEIAYLRTKYESVKVEWMVLTTGS